MKYAIDLIETRTKTIIVDANNVENAMGKVEDAYEHFKINLDKNYKDTYSIQPSKHFDDAIFTDEENINSYEQLN